MSYLVPTYDALTVALSILIAGCASFVALDLARHVRDEDPAVARNWLIGGSFAIATGIWSMHFTGMHAFVLPIAVGYGKLLTAASFAAAFAVSMLALKLTARGALTKGRLAAGSLTMGLGICAMHYTGMAAIDVSPGIVWHWGIVAASAAIAVTASAAALLIFSWLPTVDAGRRLRYQALAAMVMGAAIAGMHYTGMAAAAFPAGALCVTAGTLRGDSLVALIAVGTFMLLACALFASIVDAHTRRKTAILAASLESANVRLANADDAIRASETFDPLTHLLNRKAFEQHLIDAVMAAKRGGRRAGHVAVLSIDITGLRAINESLGHDSGDEVIRQVARRIGAEVRQGDAVARFAGDRFVVLMDGVERADDCTTLANRIVAAVAEPCALGDRRIQVNACLGIAMQEDEPRQDLISQSDTALQAAKRAGGRGSHVFFKAHMQAEQVAEFDLVEDLRGAIRHGQLELHYQPKVDSRRQQICGVEALLRWTHPARGPVSPAVFIPLAERFDLINAIGDWVIESACRQQRAWADVGAPMRIAINVSAQQLGQGDFAERILSAMERHGVDPSRLILEVTESAAMQDLAATTRTFDALGDVGIYLSIDDFGTGYSSLAYLRQLPARQLKIDRSFVKDLETSKDARALVDGIVRLSHALDLHVVAEGVETTGQRDMLIDLGCDELQGYLFARPMSAAMLYEWMTGAKPEGAVDFTRSLVLDVA